MRLAIIADIHGNSHALATVLADIKTQAPDLTVNLGDHLSGPFNVVRTADMLMAADFPSVNGNHDRAILETDPDEMGMIDLWALRQLSAEHLDWLRSLPATRIAAEGVFICHATPQDDSVPWMDDFNGDGDYVSKPLKEIERIAAGLDYSLLLCGHTHNPRVVRLSGGRLLVNPGSAGYPGYRVNEKMAFSAGTPHARYAIADRTAKGWSVSFRALDYDHEAAAREAEAAAHPFMPHVLRTGWVPDQAGSGFPKQILPAVTENS